MNIRGKDKISSFNILSYIIIIIIIIIMLLCGFYHVLCYMRYAVLALTVHNFHF